MSHIAVDASALIAVLNREPEHQSLSDALIDPTAIVGAPTLFEVHVWMQRNLETFRVPWLDEWLERPSTHVVAFDHDLEQAATGAYRQFGKGLHPAALNFGDCMAYAVAMVAGLPLLFKGGNFGKTDVAIHPASVLL